MATFIFELYSVLFQINKGCTSNSRRGQALCFISFEFGDHVTWVSFPWWWWAYTVKSKCLSELLYPCHCLTQSDALSFYGRRRTHNSCCFNGPNASVIAEHFEIVDNIWLTNCLPFIVKMYIIGWVPVSVKLEFEFRNWADDRQLNCFHWLTKQSMYTLRYRRLSPVWTGIFHSFRDGQHDLQFAKHVRSLKTRGGKKSVFTQQILIKLWNNTSSILADYVLAFLALCVNHRL